MKYLFLLLSFLWVYSCNAQSKKDAEIIQKALNIPAAKKYFHSELKSRNPYYLVENKYVDKGYKLSIHTIPVLMIKKAQLSSENYLRITKLMGNNTNITLNYYYKIENIAVSVIFAKISGKWQVQDYKNAQF